MRVPLSWLREYVAFEASAAELARRLSVSTLEVERVLEVGVPDVDGNLGRFRVGKVVEAAKHPNADRLQLCAVDVGEGEPRSIVCGAWNFGPGATVAVALPGAVLPTGLTLERREVRGETSDGMILAEDEVDLGRDHDGIMLLPEGLEPGTPLADALPIREQVLDVTPTMNRGDLLSVYGLAREVAALFGGELRPMPGGDDPPAGDEPVDVRVDDPEGCPRYIGRLFRGVELGPSPMWMRARLHAAGMRAHSNVVDVTNYVMHALGSPLHAFDAARLGEGRIVVRRARVGEEIRTLDGDLRKLAESDLVIADAERPVAIAGVMGGLESEVGEGTTDVLLEAANFEPITILKTSERLGMRSDASNRWEKGVDPHVTDYAAAYASALILETAGGALAGSTDVSVPLPERPVVQLRPERTSRIVGIEIDEAEQRDILGRLRFEVDGDWHVTVPSWRARDVRREIDVVEEVARVVLDRVPFTMPLRRAVEGRLTKDQRLRRVVEDVLVGAGFSEAYTWSLVADDPHPDALRLPDPLSSEQAVLRTTLVHGLVPAAQANLDAGNEDIALFEIARVYLPSGEQLPDERWRAGGIVQGGFLAAKGAVELLYETLKLELRVESGDAPGHLHPGKAARTADGELGELHPALLEGSWGIFELDLAGLLARVPERLLYEDVLTYPALLQDIAVAVGEEVPAGALVDAVREAVGPDLREARIFDVYRGEQVGEGRKSVAIRLRFQSSERTLTDADASGYRERIVAVLAERFGAELRAS